MTIRGIGVCVLALAAAAALPSGAAAGQSRMVMIRADVPFDFYVGSTLLPKGDYYIESKSTEQVLSVTGQGEKAEHAFSPVDFIEKPTEEVPDTGLLVFNVYGDKHFLSEVWETGTSTGLKLPVSKDEEELAKAGKAERKTVKGKPRK